MKISIQHITPNAEWLLSECAAICYNSDTSNPGRNTKRLGKIIASGHLSVLRFAHAVIRIEGISRACSHQVVRHKHLDYLQRSQRYCSEELAGPIIPDQWDVTSPDTKARASTYLATAKRLYQQLLKDGWRKEDARYFLPQAMETELMVVGNFQAWRDFIKLRTDRAAQWEIRAVAQEIKHQLAQYAPITFGGIIDDR